MKKIITIIATIISCLFISNVKGEIDKQEKQDIINNFMLSLNIESNDKNNNLVAVKFDKLNDKIFPNTQQEKYLIIVVKTDYDLVTEIQIDNKIYTYFDIELLFNCYKYSYKNEMYAAIYIPSFKYKDTILINSFSVGFLGMSNYSTIETFEVNYNKTFTNDSKDDELPIDKNEEEESFIKIDTDTIIMGSIGLIFIIFAYKIIKKRG